MSIKKYIADADTTITDAFKANLTTRASGSNMGLSDAVEIFSIYGQTFSAGAPPVGSVEKCRFLMKFPVSTIIADRAAGNIPGSGGVSFMLNVYNAVTPHTLPKDFVVNIYAVSAEWTEGDGLDMEDYSDPGAGATTGAGATWSYRSRGNAWATPGGDYHTALADPKYTATFPSGSENLSVDITALVEEWILGSGGGGKDNYGIGVMLSGSFEDGTNLRSYYDKKFFARGTEFFFKKPSIEARWDATEFDDRGNFYAASPMLIDADNTNRIYLKSYVDGSLKDILNNPALLPTLKIYSDGTKTTPLATWSTGVRVAAGNYYVTGTLDTERTSIYVEWVNSADETMIWHTETIEVHHRADNQDNTVPEYVTAVSNLKASYGVTETARFRLYTRLKDWSPTIYTVAVADPEVQIIEEAYYKIFRVVDGFTIIDYSAYDTTEPFSTRLSYDVSGSYFDFDMTLLEPGYMYGMKFLYKIKGEYKEQPDIFKFRVEEKIE